MPFVRLLLVLLTLSTHSMLLAEDGKPPSAEQLEFFEKKIRPVLADRCFSCHGPEKQKASLRLDSGKAIIKGGESGKVILPGEPDKSLLIKAVKRESETPMPPKEADKLSAEEVANLTTWVKMGAPWPADREGKSNDDAWKKHWAFQPVQQRPATESNKPLSVIIDERVKTRLATEKMTGTVPADPATLYRRAKYDLLGLPASYEETQKFVAEVAKDPNAFSKVIEQLLNDPGFGEHWGRHWLDLARYADNKGYIGVGVDRTYPFAWTYRDWVINALNSDLPYDQFLFMQIAADQAPPKEDNKRDLAGLGFQTVGRRFIGNIHEIIDDRIDTTFRTAMGLTVSCARCHDHKYDPIGIQDYYSLYGVFQSSREPELDEMPSLGIAVDPKSNEEFQKQLTKLQGELAKFETDNAQMKKERHREYIEKVKPFQNRIKKLYSDHAGAPPRGMVLLDKNKAEEPVVFLRGNPANRGNKVPRQFLPFLSSEKPKPFAVGSGRAEMASAIIDAKNPLTARVAVNRVWMHLIGQPLVRTPSDFGLRGEAPTHPELLDDLASRFTKGGWSVKQLIREIMLSKTYQLSSDTADKFVQQDPENRLLSRMNRKRLTWEGMRDGMLYVSGQLDRTMAGPSIDLTRQRPQPRRTVYGFIDRQNLPGLFRTFDFALPEAHAPNRFTTTVPQQALYFLNSEFLQQQANVILERKEVAAATEPRTKINLLYQLCLARDASVEELEVLVGYVGAKTDPATWQQVIQGMLMLNEWMFVD